MESPDYSRTIPKDVVIHMMKFFDAKSLCEFSQCCKLTRECFLIYLPKTAWMDKAMILYCKIGSKLFLDLYSEWKNPAARNNAAIITASHYGYLKAVELLINNPNVNPSAGDNYAIGIASQNGYLEIVRLLLKCDRVNPAANNNYAITWASKGGHSEIVKLLNQKRKM